MLVAGTLSDIFDGLLARRLGVATPAWRRYDSIANVIDYLFVLGAAWILCRPVLERNGGLLALIILSVAAGVRLCCAKFGKYPATHSRLAKFYGPGLLSGLIALLVFNAGGWIINPLASVALVTNTEMVVIHLLMRQPPVDVKTVFALPPTGKP